MDIPMANKNGNKDQIIITKNDEYKLWQIGKSNALEEVINSTTHWHRFTIINGASYLKDDILILIIEQSHPGDLIPVKYRSDGRDTFFIARNCGMAIRFLCLSLLSFRFAKGNCNIELELILNYVSLEDEPLVMQRHILQANAARYNYHEKTLDLSNYHNDPELKDIFCPLSISKIMKYVLCSIRHYFNRMTTLVLSNNGLTSLEVLDLLIPAKVLTTLDLRNNEINWEGLERLSKCFKVKEIWLDGNPLCEKYSTPGHYIAHIKQKIPSLSHIDGQNVEEVESDLILSCRNFLVNPTVTCSLVDQFIDHYFNLFALKDRMHLVAMYHAKAMFSMTARHIPLQSTSNTTRIEKYMNHNRNTLKMSNFDKAFEHLRVGPQEIVNLLCTLPYVQFDPYSFTVDCPYFEDQMIIINVAGVFIEKGRSELYAFDRAFVLQPSRSTHEWTIINDMLSISNATSAQEIKSFKSKKDSAFDLMGNEKIDKDKLVKTMYQLTTLRSSWCNRFLHDARWDLENALKSFTEQYIRNKIPKEAFSVPK